MKTLSIICSIALFALVLNECDTNAKNLTACIKGTSGDNHCCWTTKSMSSDLTISQCLTYNKDEFAKIKETIEKEKEKDKNFNIECEEKSSSSGSTSSSLYLKIGIITLLAILF